MHPSIQEHNVDPATLAHRHETGANAPAWGHVTRVTTANNCSSRFPEDASAPRRATSELEPGCKLIWHEDTPHREVPEPENRLAEFGPLVAVVIVFLALSLTAGVVFDTYISRSSPDATSTATSSLSPAGMSGVTRQLSGDNATNPPTAAELIYIIGGMSP